MASGILDTIGLAGWVLLAAPIALFGAEFLISGQPLQGVVFLALAAAMILLPRYVHSPGDAASETAADVASAVVSTEDEEE